MRGMGRERDRGRSTSRGEEQGVLMGEVNVERGRAVQSVLEGNHTAVCTAGFQVQQRLGHAE